MIVTIPPALQERRQWLTWRLEKDPQRPNKTKLLKVPYYVDGGRRYGEQGSERDLRRLAVYTAAVKAAPAPGLELGNGGVGIAFLPDDGLIGIDLDHAIDEDGVVSERAVEIIKRCDSFTEYSPSGRGLHIYVTGKSKTNTFDPIGVEIYCGGQYFTVTGRHYAGTPLEVREISAEALQWLHDMIETEKAKAKAAKTKAVAPAKPAPAKAPASSSRSSTSSSDDFKRVNDAAIANLDAWVPTLFPGARRATGGYRVSSADLGRELEEDLSITNDGIVDWGVADQGDAREGRRTPIDVVIEWSSVAKKPADALHWLADCLGITLERRAGRGRDRDDGAGDRDGSGEDSGKSGKPPADDEGRREYADDDRRPKIYWTQGRLHECVDQAEDALLKSGLRIYQRAGYLVRVLKRDTPSVRDYKQRLRPGSLGLQTVDVHYLIEAFTRAARWLKWNSQKNDWVPTNAPEQAANTYLARRGHWQLPRLWSAISAPTLRPDGTVLQDPGYDKDTATWYDPCGIEFPRIQESPDKDDAKKALEKLRAAFKSFPFERPVDESVALALALTSLVRRSLPSAPMGAITAPVMASGKTLLADSISILAHGVSAPAMKYADTDEEATKTMLAILAEGDPVCLIDNVERPLQGAELCAVLTQESYRQRVLGRTEMMTVPTTTLWLATGNHLVIQGDLRTRALLCRIDPKTEHPEQRQFEVEKREWIMQHRPELVAAGLTIMRAFVCTGQDPRDLCKTWGRFERWSDMVRAPLLWLDCEDPCQSLKDLEKEDPERVELVRMITAWFENFGPDKATASSAIAAAASNDKLKAVLEEVCKARDGTLDARKLGHWLRKHAGRYVSDSGLGPDGKPRTPKPPRRFARDGEKDHSTLWKVEAMS
jgi:hypothetical protein